MDRLGARIGSLVGSGFGLVFVLTNAGDLPAAPMLRVVAGLAFVAVVAIALRSRAESRPPERGALRVYGMSVLAMVVGFVVGGQVLAALDRPDLVLCWVVLVVGAHFLPFARAFRAPVFLPMAGVLMAVGLVGGAGVLAGVDHADDATAVAAGFVLLGFAGYGAARQPVSAAA